MVQCFKFRLEPGCSHLCIAGLQWRLAAGCRQRWGSGLSRAAGRWCRRFPRPGDRWADAGCRWIRWRWAWRCWARRRWWCWLVESWGLLGEKKRKPHCYWLTSTRRKHSSYYKPDMMQGVTVHMQQGHALLLCMHSHTHYTREVTYTYTHKHTQCLRPQSLPHIPSNARTRVRCESVTYPAFVVTHPAGLLGSQPVKNEPVCSVCAIPCWLPLLRMMKPLCNFREREKNTHTHRSGRDRKRLQKEICLNEQVVKTQRCLLL